MSDKRLDRMLPLLSAKERAVMMLRDYKAGKAQDMTLMRTAPAGQTEAINRHIGMMNAANADLANIVLVIHERVTQEELRFGLLTWADMAATELWAVRCYYNIGARETITASEYREREAETRKELIPADECAWIYTECHHVFDARDYARDEAGKETVADAVWERVYDEKLAEIRSAAANGTLKARGKGRRMEIACGSFYDWIGAPVAVAPEFGMSLDVRPDSEREAVERARRDDAFIREILNRGACKLDLPLDMESPVRVEPSGRFDENLARSIAIALRARLGEHWRELRAVEEQIDAFTAEFDGEDVLYPTVRERLDSTKQSLLDLHTQLQEYTGPFELPEPNDEVRGLIRRIVERELEGPMVWG